jgi:hypothetical protein
VPVVVEAVRLIASPVHTGVFEPMAGVPGVALMVTATVDTAEVHPFSVMVTEYVPASASVAGVTIGFCTDDEKLLGPLQEYVPVAADEVRLSASPVQTGEFDPATRAAGVALIITVDVASEEEQPLTVTVRL